MFIGLLRIIKFAFQSLMRNVWLSIVTVVIIILALFSTTFLMMFNLMTEHTLSVVESKTDVYIDLTKDATREQAEVLTDELGQLAAISQAEFITPEQTLENFRNRHQDNDLILESLEALEDNPFRGSIRLNVNRIEDFPVILSELSKTEYAQFLEVEDREFTDAKLLIEGISEYSEKIQRAGLIISLIFVVISILVVLNTIQVGIYTHKEEIGIMRLVGASSSFIRSPFLIEATVYSLLAVIILVIIIYPLLGFIQPYVDGFFKEYSANLTVLVNQNFLKIFGLQLLGAVVITVISSFIAVRRYVKV